MSEAAMMSIGAVSRATGIPSSTLRTWERRYGFPVPERTDGGQRAYSPNVVPKLRLVARALERGHRAGAALKASDNQLREWAGPAAVPRAEAEVDTWIDATRRLDGETLEQGFRHFTAKKGLTAFVGEAAAYLTRMGEAWHAGHLGVHHEHQASERLRGFLFSAWRDLADRNSGRSMVCACLPGERHDLGLHMAAAALATGGARVVFLGADAPVDSIVQTASEVSPRAVVVSISVFVDPDQARQSLVQLRERLPRAIEIVVGGGGAMADVEGTLHLDRLADLTAWAGG